MMMIFIVEKWEEEEEDAVRTVLANWINVDPSQVAVHIATVSYLFC